MTEIGVTRAFSEQLGKAPDRQREDTAGRGDYQRGEDARQESRASMSAANFPIIV